MTTFDSVCDVCSSLKRIVAVATLAALPLQAAAVAQELTQPLLKLTAVGGIDYLPELFEETVAPEPVVAPLPAPAPVKPVVVKPAEPQVRSVSQGEASWYGPGFFGNLTANGEIYSPGTMTAAHRTLPSVPGAGDQPLEWPQRCGSH